MKAAPSGATHVIEPVAQFIWASSNAEVLPNEDSVLVEFDEGSLFSLDRFPGSDAVERGPRANLGVTWTRYDPSGWSMGVTLGRVFREADLDQEVAAAVVGPITAALPAEPRGGVIPFGPVVEVPGDAPAYVRLVGWVGRDPEWTPAAG